MNDLVHRLINEQEVEVKLRPERRPGLFKEFVDRGTVQIVFTQTQRNTELSVRIDHEMSDFSKVNWEQETGLVTIVGELILNYVRVFCHATIDLVSLAGTGHLEVIEEVTPSQMSKERAEQKGL